MNNLDRITAEEIVELIRAAFIHTAPYEQIRRVREIKAAANIFNLIQDRERRQEGGWRPTHRHVKRGTDYQVVDYAGLQTDQPIDDHTLLTVYRGQDGLLWARPSKEFTDGRFIKLPTPADAEPSQGAEGERTAPDWITYNPGYQVTYDGADPTRGYVYRLVSAPPPHAEDQRSEAEWVRWLKITDATVEAAARAMCEKGGFDPFEIMSNGGPRWKYYLPGAETALTAALALFPARPDAEAVGRLKITDAMVKAATQALYDDHVAEAFEPEWKAKIRAALVAARAASPSEAQEPVDGPDTTPSAAQGDPASSAAFSEGEVKS